MRIIASTSKAPTSLQSLITAPYLGALSLFAGAALRRDMPIEEAADLLDAGFGTFGGAHFDTLAWILDVRALAMPTLTVVLPEPGRIAGIAGGPRGVMAALAGGQALTVGDGAIAQHLLTVAPPDMLRRALSTSQGSTWRRHRFPLRHRMRQVHVSASIELFHTPTNGLSNTTSFQRSPYGRRRSPRGLF